MTDYTPTTEEIRAGWEYATAVIGDEGTAQFDRWLAEVKAEAVAEWLAERMAAFEKADLEAYEQGETE